MVKKIANPFPQALLEVLDNSGRPLLLMPQASVIRQKLRHKRVLVGLRDHDDRIFIHKRPSQEQGLWDISASGVVLAGESSYGAAVRLLTKETGVSGVELFYKASLPTSENAENIQFDLYVTSKTSSLPNHDEESPEGFFLDQDELAALLRDFPATVSLELRLASARVFTA